eukprot:gnl/Spiro4/13317_TR7084_c0_g1_i1.p2 gnl/Spiro4/13317_TR7084_c0_g1~~gnl/Spiro4/13317_TR7084_c0_g1_i1.p2  ORF type:complete len:110 (-),score=10.41 gnl/Spiro4/13317_TR7084_c0_g1_i1:79-408(-)
MFPCYGSRKREHIPRSTCKVCGCQFSGTIHTHITFDEGHLEHERAQLCQQIRAKRAEQVRGALKKENKKEKSNHESRDIVSPNIRNNKLKKKWGEPGAPKGWLSVQLPV